MRLRQLRIHQLRNLNQVELAEISESTVVHGSNGSGKTSILEAIHLLGTGRPFRRARFRPLIQYEANGLQVAAELHTENSGSKALVNIERFNTGVGRTYLNSQQVSVASELADILPIQTINSDVFELLDGMPAIRREFMDWGVFHVKPTFREHWKQARRCVRQRNVLLRAPALDHKLMELWSQRLADCAAQVDEMRKDWFDAFVPIFGPILKEMLPPRDNLRLDLNYERGWGDFDLLESLLSDWERERALGYTRVGPQRSDLDMRVEGHNASSVLSRGQKKVVAAALRVAQAEYVRLEANKPCALLVDDMAAELDEAARNRFCTVIDNTEHQIFMTCIELNCLPAPWREGDKVNTFHVKHGKIKT